MCGIVYYIPVLTTGVTVTAPSLTSTSSGGDGGGGVGWQYTTVVAFDKVFCC